MTLKDITFFSISCLLIYFCRVTCEFNHQNKSHMHHHHHYQRNASILVFDHKACSNCIKELLHLSTFSLQSLVETLEKNTSYSQRSNSSIFILRSFADQSIEEIGRVLDQFVSSRPWWIIELEPYAWLPWIRDVILHRVPNTISPHFEAISEQNFLSPTACAAAPLQVSGHVFDAWGNRILNIEMEWANCIQAVFSIYITISNKPTDTVGFVEADICPTITNKWECVFLPTTNCTLPNQLMTCNEPSCMPRSWGSQYYTNASDLGIMLTGDEEKEFANNARTNTPHSPNLTPRECIHQIGYRSKTPVTRVDEETSEQHKQSCNINVMPAVFTRGFVFRFNAAFRSIVNHKVFTFRLETEPPFLPSATCVAAHIRMHDRAIPNTDMVAYCKNCTSYSADGSMHFNCTHIDSGAWYDYGCFSQAPFGVLTLDHFLNASRVILPHNRNIFIMTDDPAWLEEQMISYKQRPHSTDTFNVYAFPAGANHRMASSAATVDFWASVKLAQQCDGFVGHFSSASTALVYNTMCYRHGYSKFLRCPIAYDLGAQQL